MAQGRVPNPKSIFHYYNEHGSHENLFYILNIHWIYFILT